MNKMKQASDRMEKIKAEKEARMKKQFEAKMKEELEKKRRDEAQRLQKKRWNDEYQKELKLEKEKQLEHLKKERMRIMKDLEREFEEQRKKIQGKGEVEPEATPYQEDDDQDDWEENNEDSWSRWHHEGEHTEKEESSKESSFVVVSDGKRTSMENSPQEAKKDSPRDPDIIEAFKLVVESGQKTLKMIIDSQKEKGTNEEDKLDQEDHCMKVVDVEPLEEPTEESAAII
jgi:trichohyalin